MCTRVRMIPLISSTDMSAFLHSPCSHIMALTRSFDGWQACSQDSWFWNETRQTLSTQCSAWPRPHVPVQPTDFALWWGQRFLWFVKPLWMKDSKQKDCKDHITDHWRSSSSDLTPVISCCRLSSSLLRLLDCGSTILGLYLPFPSLSLLPVEAESGPCRSSSHIVSSVSEAGREPTPGLRRSTSRGLTLLEAALPSCFQYIKTLYVRKIPKSSCTSTATSKWCLYIKI